jgi:hypothetical protein
LPQLIVGIAKAFIDGTATQVFHLHHVKSTFAESLPSA